MYDNTNTGVLFKNEQKEEGSKHPDYRGKINIEGEEYELAGWIQTAKNTGKKFMSLTITKGNK